MNDEEHIVAPPLKDQPVLVKITAGVFEEMVLSSAPPGEHRTMAWGTPDEAGAYVPAVFVTYDDDEIESSGGVIVWLMFAVILSALLVGLLIGSVWL